MNVDTKLDLKQKKKYLKQYKSIIADINKEINNPLLKDLKEMSIGLRTIVERECSRLELEIKHLEK